LQKEQERLEKEQLKQEQKLEKEQRKNIEKDQKRKEAEQKRSQYTFVSSDNDAIDIIINEIQTKFIYCKDQMFYKDGNKWNRVYTIPQTSMNTEIDPFSSADFVKKTGEKKGTLGDLWDKSAELSEKRAKVHGNDPVKDKTISAYEAKTKKKHPSKLNKNITI
jgi:hypothetical protein